MTYDAIEKSEFGSEPIELFEFDREGELSLFTSSDEAITFEDKTYTAIAIKRTSVFATQELGKNGIKINMTRKTSFSNQFIQSTPNSIIKVTVTTFHRGDAESVVTWKGRVLNVAFKENEVIVSCESNFSSLRRPGLRRLYQLNCPHVLYGTQCKVVKLLHRVVGTVDNINGLDIRVDATIDAELKKYTGGFVEVIIGDFTQREFITANDTPSGVLTLAAQIPGLVLGLPILAQEGCDHTAKTCNDKFDNIAFFGGFPWMPLKNPMNGTSIF